MQQSLHSLVDRRPYCQSQWTLSSSETFEVSTRCPRYWQLLHIIIAIIVTNIKCNMSHATTYIRSPPLRYGQATVWWRLHSAKTYSLSPHAPPPVHYPPLHPVTRMGARLAVRAASCKGWDGTKETTRRAT